MKKLSGRIVSWLSRFKRKDGSRSLMVPTIKNADSLDFGAFHSYYEDLITKTRENKLTADDRVL